MSGDVQRDDVAVPKRSGPVTRPAIFAIAGALLLLTAVVLGIAVRAGPLSLDIAVRDALAPVASSWTRQLFDAYVTVGEPLVWDVAVAFVAGLLWLRGRRSAAILGIATLIAGEALASGLKLAIDRARPAGVVVTDLITQASYPSGHMTRIVVTAGLFVWLASRRHGVRAPAVVVALVACVAMAVARTIEEHWATDVIGAVLVGLAVLAFAAAIAAQRATVRPEIRRTTSNETP